MRLRTLMTALAVSALGLGALTLTAPTAAASAQWMPSNCGSGNFCIYDNQNFGGRMWAWAGNNDDYTRSGANDRASSWANNGIDDGWARVWVFQNTSWDHQYGNLLACLGPGEAYASLDGSQDNQASAHTWEQRC
ncbi:peptidase inhibitor family I36 protein [Streptomyces sp. NPDC060031]|uniref:peptidase inhibitor family I36 protein n=1 Tax=Streptomyces sp. NPDC060031 TaxID=3347043 RepID=UPI0036CF47BE